MHELEDVRAWSGHTASGDIAELGLVSEDSVVWPRVTSTVENCLDQECEYFQHCFVVKVRRNALEAVIVVINHHLLFADMVLKEEGFGELLPGADAFIIDEAHQLPCCSIAHTEPTCYELKQVLCDSQARNSVPSQEI